MEKISGNKINILTRLTKTKNMLGVMFAFCDLKTACQLRNVNRKFREVIDSEKVMPIFTEFLNEIKFINTDIKDLYPWGIFYYATLDKEGSYYTKLTNRLTEKSFTPSQIDDFISLLFSSYWTVHEATEFSLNTDDLHDEPADNQYLRIICQALKKNSTLSKLQLNFDSDSNPYLLKLLNEVSQGNSNISSLWLKLCSSINDETFENLCKFIKIESNIRELDLDGSGCLFYGKPDYFSLMIESLKENKSIKEIILTGWSIVDSALNMIILSDFLKTTHHIQKLNLKAKQWDINSLTFLARKNNLQILFEALVQDNYPLIELDLPYINFGPAIQNLSIFLKANQTLTKLNLAYNCILTESSIEEMVAFSEALTINNTIQELNLEGNDFHGWEDRIEVLSQAIKVNKSVKILNLNNTKAGLYSNSLRFLSDAIIGNTTILTLYLQNNRFGEKCNKLIPLCEAIEKNKTIKELYLDRYSIGYYHHNFNDLTLALAKNKTINKLGLSRNCLLLLDHLSFQNFCEMIQKSSSLKELDFSNNSFEEHIPFYGEIRQANKHCIDNNSIELRRENFRLFSEAIRKNNSISILNLSDNELERFITKDILQNFFTALEENESLKTVHLNNCDIKREDYLDQLECLRLKMNIQI